MDARTQARSNKSQMAPWNRHAIEDVPRRRGRHAARAAEEAEGDALSGGERTVVARAHEDGLLSPVTENARAPDRADPGREPESQCPAVDRGRARVRDRHVGLEPLPRGGDDREGDGRTEDRMGGGWWRDRDARRARN